MGRDVTTHKNLSDATAQMVDGEIRRIIDEQYARARKILEENKDKVEVMAKALLEWETLDTDQINDIMEGKNPRPPLGPADTASDPKSSKPGRKTRAKPRMDTPAGEH